MYGRWGSEVDSQQRYQELLMPPNEVVWAVALALGSEVATATWGFPTELQKTMVGIQLAQFSTFSVY